eukprot:3646206-Lingulodinium_polyedra.AAC.1
MENNAAGCRASKPQLAPGRANAPPSGRSGLPLRASPLTRPPGPTKSVGGGAKPWRSTNPGRQTLTT